jgi:hypothetical protein
MGLIGLYRLGPSIATVFTTHATFLGRHAIWHYFEKSLLIIPKTWRFKTSKNGRNLSRKR